MSDIQPDVPQGQPDPTIADTPAPRMGGDGRSSVDELNRLMGVFFALWTLLVVALALISLNQLHRDMLNDLRVEARIAHRKDVDYRHWNTQHGGVYVFVSEDTQPNPYLTVEDRDLTTTDGRRLTMINPAYMTRQVHESALKEHGVIGHITSLDPLRPGNAPDSWEAEALRQFADGTTTEVSSIATLNGGHYMRLMRPLYVEEGCLACHGHQGYKVGEVRGGISVAVPVSEKANAQYRTIYSLLAAYLLIWLAGSGGGFVAFRRLKAETLDRMQTRQQLQVTVAKLEEKTQALDLALEQADAANHIKSNFLAMMSHEMRTPMTSIIGFSDVLRNSELSAEQHEYLQHVYEAAQNLSNIINTLLEFSKLDRGSIELRREQFTATSIIADTIPSRKAAADSKNLKLTTAISPEMPQTVVGDKERIVKVVGNLLDNAIHHTSDGRVELRIEVVGNDPLMLKITVSDNGPGIPEELVSNLFDSFSQAEPVLTRAKGGIGLGLAICQRLVLLMGGTLGYEPNEPHGAVFWFTVPVE